MTIEESSLKLKNLIIRTYDFENYKENIEIMNVLRHFYRNFFVETILLLAVLVQIISGLKLFRTNRKNAKTNFEKLHIWTGLYLAIFFVIHLSAILGGRLFLHLDTNFYFEGIQIDLLCRIIVKRQYLSLFFASYFVY